MTRWRCTSCGGTYDDVGPDGSLYFHACPPDRVDETGARVPIDDPRDENVVPGYTHRTGPAGGRPTTLVHPDGRELGLVDHPIKAEGKGRTRVGP